MPYGKCHCNILPTSDDYLIDFSTAFNFVASEVNMSKVKAQAYVISTFSPFLNFTIEEKREITGKWTNNDEYSNMFADHLNNFVFANKFIKFAKFLNAMEKLQLEFGVKILEESLKCCAKLVGKTPDEAIRDIRSQQEDMYNQEKEEMIKEIEGSVNLGVRCKCEPTDFDISTDNRYQPADSRENGNMQVQEKLAQFPMKRENLLAEHGRKRKSTYKNLKHGLVYSEVLSTKRRSFRDTENYRYQMRLQKNFPDKLNLIFNDNICHKNLSTPRQTTCKNRCSTSKHVKKKEIKLKNQVTHTAIEIQLIKLGFAHISDHLYTIPVSGIKKRRSHKQYQGLLKNNFTDLKAIFEEYYRQVPEISDYESESFEHFPNSTSAISKSTLAKLRLLVEKRTNAKNQNFDTSLDNAGNSKGKSCLAMRNNSSHKQTEVITSSSSKCINQTDPLFVVHEGNIPSTDLKVDKVENITNYRKEMSCSETGNDNTPSCITEVESVAMALCEFSTGITTQSSFTDELEFSSKSSEFSSSEDSPKTSENSSQDSKSQVISIDGIGKFQLVRVGCLQ